MDNRGGTRPAGNNGRPMDDRQGQERERPGQGQGTPRAGGFGDGRGPQYRGNTGSAQSNHFGRNQGQSPFLAVADHDLEWVRTKNQFIIGNLMKMH